MKVLLEAPVLTQSGYGEHSRFVLRSLRTVPGIDLYINPLGWGTTSWMCDVSEERGFVDECIRKSVIYNQQCQHAGVSPSFDLQIHVGIPNEFSKKAEHSVCVTAGIETTKVAPKWLTSVASGIDKLIVPSNHAKEGFENTSYTFEHNGQKIEIGCRAPVVVVPYPAKKKESKEVKLDLEYDFNFLSVAMWGIRKNMPNMIRWFVEEFKDDPVGLVLKTNFSRNSTPDRLVTKQALESVLSEYEDRKCKVYLLHGDLTDEEIHSLYENPKIKAYVTATHGEGFGLPIFEAAYSGLPIVATNWSGHLDFLSAPVKSKKTRRSKSKALFAKVDYDLEQVPPSAVWNDIIVEDSKWAMPKEKSFKSQIRKMYKEHKIYRGFAKTLQDHVSDEYEYSKMLEIMKSELIPESLAEDVEWADALSSIEVL